MTALAIKTFDGIAPKIPARYLPDSGAQTALNANVFNGSLQPLANIGSSVTTLTKAGTPLTIYRFGQDIVSDTQYWFHWTTDVDVCRGQIAGDTSEWTYYTDGVQPKATYASIATSGSDYPTNSIPLGLPAPTTAPVATAGALPPSTNAIQETRVYTFTYVNKVSGVEVESAPSPASSEVTVYPTQSVTIGTFAAVPAGYTATHRRIYRSTAGVYLFVAEIAIATSSYTDSILAEDLGEELPSLTWTTPPDTLIGLINLPNGMMAGFKGRDVYFCVPYRPYAWPLQYIQSLDYPVVGLGRMDTTLAVLTKGVPYFIQGSSPDAMVVVKSNLEQACASKRSIVSFGNVVLYASPDGLVMLSPGNSKVLTDNMFTRAQWQSLFLPTSIHAYQQDMKYIAFYNNGVTSGGFVFDMLTGKFTVNDTYATAGYTDLQNDKLFLTFADRSVKVWLAGAARNVTWKSKKFSMPRFLGFAAAKVEAESYNLTAKFYADGTLIHTQTVTSRDPFRLPPIQGRDWEVQVETAYEVFSIAMAESVEELKSV